MNLKKALFLIIFLFFFSKSALSGWTPAGYKISIIDSLTGDNQSYITLRGYENVICDENRILLKSTNTQNYSEMISMVLSAFHADTEVRFLINDVNNTCLAERVMLIK